MSRITLAVSALLLLLGRATAGPSFDTLSDTLRAVWTASVEKYYDDGSTTYFLTDEWFDYGGWFNWSPPPVVQGWEHATARFDLSSIPDTALVTAVEFGFFQFTDDSEGTPSYSIRVYDYPGANEESLFKAVDTAQTVSSRDTARYGWNRVPLTDAGTRWVKDHLLADCCRLAVAEQSFDEMGRAYGYQDPESLRPYLLVNYLPTAIGEAGGYRLDPGLRLYPNPATGSVTICCPANWTGRAVLTLCDASGRVVMKQQLDNGIARLDCRRLANGVHFVRCVSAGRLASGRLTVRH
jgi:hypothetical protein